MILIYPMLTSGSVSPNVLPGIVKAVEKYILLYNTDEVLRAASISSAGNIITTGVKIAAGIATLGAAAATMKHAAGTLKAGYERGKEFSDFGMGTFENYNLVEDSTKLSSTKSGQRPEKDKEKKPAPIKVDIPSVKPSLDLPKSDAVSLEPTWLTVTTQKKGIQILGIKVVPFRVKSGESISSIMNQDTKLKFLDYLATKYGRAITRVFFRIMRKVRLPMIKDRALSGDPKTDIIFGETQYGRNMFVCLNQLDIENDEIFSTPAGVQRLHKLGWVSFVVLDDVNRKATFCMKEFGGVCSVVPYGFVFSSLGKEHSKVYEDLEDLKKSSGPFFNMRTNRRNTFSENTTAKLDKYLKSIQG